MLDAVPFAGARRVMGDRDSKAGFIGQLLKLDLPLTHASPVAIAHPQKINFRITAKRRLDDMALKINPLAIVGSRRDLKKAEAHSHRAERVSAPRASMLWEPENEAARG
jgi:hypothetical protein